MNKKLTVTPTNRQLLLGAAYTVLSLLVLPNLLSFAVTYFSIPLSVGMLNFSFFVLNFAVTVGIFYKFLLASIRDLRRKLARILGIALLALGLYWIGNLALSLFILTVEPAFINVNDSAIAVMASKDYGLLAFGTVLLVPIAEELMFRGVLFAGLYNRSRIGAFAASTLVFCSIHVMGYIGLYPPRILLLCFLQYIPAGLCLGWAYAKTGNIFTPILMHTAINAIGILAMR